MQRQNELFPPEGDFHPDLSVREPRVWVRELRVLRAFEPGNENVLRRIVLQPGLNILWARPLQRDKPARLHAPGVSGHASGKTTFCRFLRHLLGEKHFGTEEQRARLRAKFPEGWLVGEVRLSEESWLVCRPFKIGPHPFVIQAARMEALFSRQAEHLSLNDYLTALDRVLTEALPVATFATAPTPIAWPHLVQWLSRDQESRFAGLADLRHSMSESESPDMSVEDRHFLFRATLDLINVAEQAELEKNKALLAKRQQAERDAPLLRFRSDSTLAQIRERMPDFRTDLAPLDFLLAVKTHSSKQAVELEAKQRTMAEPEALKIARRQQIEAESDKRAAEQQAKEISENLELIGKEVDLLHGKTTQAEHDSWVREKMGDRFCGQPLSAAIEWDCPLVRGRKLPIEKGEQSLRAAPTIEDLEKRAASEKRRLFTSQAMVTRKIEAVVKARGAAQVAERAYDAERNKLATQSAELSALAEAAKSAHSDAVEAKKLDDSLAGLEQKIRRSQELQANIREKQSATLSAFSETFGRVTRAVLGDDVEGSIKFRGRQIRPTLIHGIDLTSAALETLKIICFDLAALISGIEGRGAHPRFLIHDGPREADMDAELYQRLFLLAVEIEKAFGKAPKSFQYILTTTEPPPMGLQINPWLIDPVLDASTSGGKLLGEDF